MRALVFALLAFYLERQAPRPVLARREVRRRFVAGLIVLRKELR